MRLLYNIIACVCMLFGEIAASHIHEFDVSGFGLKKRTDTAEERNERFNDLETKLARIDEIEAKLALHDAKLVNVQELCEKKIRNDEKETMANKRHTRALSYEGDPIAFTAYLDHNLDGIGQQENLVFGHVLLNDGNGYNMNTGAFTVPVTGVYHFDFFIGERNVNQMYVWLAVNNTNQIDAVAESAHTAQDIQGGNAANLKLEKGDVVILKHYFHGTHIEGSDSTRISSFSGFLLYPTESVPIIGK